LIRLLCHTLVNKQVEELFVLSSAGITKLDITQVYISIIRSVLLYACPVRVASCFLKNNLYPTAVLVSSGLDALLA